MGFGMWRSGRAGRNSRVRVSSSGVRLGVGQGVRFTAGTGGVRASVGGESGGVSLNSFNDLPGAPTRVDKWVMGCVLVVFVGLAVLFYVWMA